MSENKANVSKMACFVCKQCKNGELHDESNNNNESNRKCNNELVEYKCNKWLVENAIRNEQCETESERWDTFSSSISELTDDNQSENDLCYQNPITDFDGQVVKVLDNLTVNQKSYENIRLEDCKNVRIGPVANIYGPVYINQTVQSITQNSVSNQVFIGAPDGTITPNELNFVKRRNWLAQPPVGEIDPLDGPVKLVIISHTATEKGLTSGENIELIRDIQTFHIESRKWFDIAYNFLIGCDGKVYEGRGWGAVGAHTYGYNKLGIGISFVGCFMKELPTKEALEQAKILIQHGIEIGQIDENYQLVGHCQCCPTESPGRTLFEEIQTWDHWCNIDSQNE